MPVSLMAEPPSLWTLIDAALEDVVTAWAAQWTEFADMQIEIGEQYNPDVVDYPFVLISGYERNYEQAEPVIGDGTFHLSGIRYPYEIIVAGAFEAFTEAKEFAAKVSASLTDALRADVTLGGLSASNGEYVLQFEFDDGELLVRGLAGQGYSGYYTGIAIVRIDVHTEV